MSDETSARWHRWLARGKAHALHQARRALARVGYGSRPDFLILGAQKCGTVALFNYLEQHPSVRPSTKKEISFFNKDVHYRRGNAWYHSHFPLRAPGLTFEATPGYLYYPQCAPRIHAYHPSMKLIVLLRNPVDRAFSAWNMFRVLRRDRPNYLRERMRTADPAARVGLAKLLAGDHFPSFSGAVRWEIEQSPTVEQQPEPSFVRRGLYAQQLERYFGLFPREQVLVINSEKLRADTAATLDEVTAFLQLPSHAWNAERLAPRHVGQYDKAAMDPETRRLLADYYAPHNATLSTLLGTEFRW